MNKLIISSKMRGLNKMQSEIAYRSRIDKDKSKFNC